MKKVVILLGAILLSRLLMAQPAGFHEKIFGDDVNCMFAQGNYIWMGIDNMIVKEDINTGVKTIYTPMNSGLKITTSIAPQSFVVSSIGDDASGNVYAIITESNSGNTISEFKKLVANNWVDIPVSPFLSVPMYRCQSLFVDAFQNVWLTYEPSAEPGYENVIVFNPVTNANIPNNNIIYPSITYALYPNTTRDTITIICPSYNIGNPDSISILKISGPNFSVTNHFDPLNQGSGNGYWGKWFHTTNGNLIGVSPTELCTINLNTNQNIIYQLPSLFPNYVPFISYALGPNDHLFLCSSSNTTPSPVSNWSPLAYAVFNPGVIFEFDGTNFTTYSGAAIPNNNGLFFHLAVDANNTLWGSDEPYGSFPSDDNIYKLNNGTFTSEKTLPGKSRQINMMSNSIRWSGTKRYLDSKGKISIIDTSGTIQTLDYPINLQQTTFNFPFIAASPNGIIWCFLSNGVKDTCFVYNGTSWIHNALDTVPFNLNYNSDVSAYATDTAVYILSPPDVQGNIPSRFYKYNGSSLVEQTFAPSINYFSTEGMYDSQGDYWLTGNDNSMHTYLTKVHNGISYTFSAMTGNFASKPFEDLVNHDIWLVTENISAGIATLHRCDGINIYDFAIPFYFPNIFYPVVNGEGVVINGYPYFMMMNKYIFRFDGAVFQTIHLPEEAYCGDVKNFGDQIFLSEGYGNIDFHVNSMAITPFINAGYVSNLSGYCFDDINSNTILDPLEGHFPAPVMVDGNFSGSMNNGNYYRWVDTGMHVIKPFLPLYHTSVPDSFIISVTNASPVILGSNDFAIETTPFMQDLSAYLYHGKFKPGYNSNCQITICNPGTVPMNVNAQFDFDPSLSLSWSPLTPAINTPGHLEWNFSLSSSQCYYIPFHLLVPNSAIIGTASISALTANPLMGDLTPGNNVVTKNDTIFGPWDPNEKSSAEVDENGNGVLDAGESINYTIEFQNTGTDTAMNIHVIDTLDSNLNLATLQVVASSAPVEIHFISNHIVEFSFEQILLPDSFVNEPASHGFVMFNIQTNAGSLPGASLSNTAFIYFDFNGAVETNTVTNSIDISSSVSTINFGKMKWKIFPNPSDGFIEIILDKPSETPNNFLVISVLGQGVKKFSIAARQQKVFLNFEELPEGIYLISDLHGEIQKFILTR